MHCNRASVSREGGLTGGEVGLLHDLGPGGVLELLVAVLDGGAVPEARVAADRADQLIHGARGRARRGARTEPASRRALAAAGPARPSPARRPRARTRPLAAGLARGAAAAACRRDTRD